LVRYRHEACFAMRSSQYEIIYRTETAHWWYRVRRDLTRKLITQFAGGRDLKILDIGCGTGGLMRELEAFGEVHGVDNSEQAIAFCHTRGVMNTKLGSITDIPYPAGSFDVVLALDVLEHVDDDIRGISEMKRVLRPGGIMIIFSPAFQFLWGTTDEVGHHHRRYTLPELRQKLSREQVTIEFSSYFNFFLFLPIFAVRTLVRVLPFQAKSENVLGGAGIVNQVLYRIFSFETALLPRISFPFGVSVLAVCRT